MTTAELIAQTQTRLTAYIAAEQSITKSGQSYSIGNRSLDRGDLKEIRQAIIDLNGQLNSLQNGNRIRMQRIVPRDGI